MFFTGMDVFKNVRTVRKKKMNKKTPSIDEVFDYIILSLLIQKHHL